MARLVFTVFFLFIFFGHICGQYSWRLKACLPGAGRVNVANFILGNKAYVVGGTTSATSSINEVWEYDPSTDIWTQKNNFPVARGGQAAFVIDDTAYVGIGSDVSGNYDTDFWKYNVTSDQWTPVAQFPGPARYLSMTFVLNGKGYLGCGHGGGENNDFYEYDPVLNSWTQKSSFPGSARQDGFGIALGSYGYMGLGFNTGIVSDSYKYDPVSDTWTQIASFTGPLRLAMGYFSLNGSIYIAGGNNSINGPYTFDDDCWQYDTASNTWIQQASFTCLSQPLNTQYGFTLNGHGYITCGYGGFFGNELLEFGPNDTTFTTRIHVLGNDTSYCNNFSRVLSTGNSCTIWSTGVIASQIAVTAPGTYWARLPDSCGMESDTIHIAVGTPIAINLGNDTSYCGKFTRVLATGDASTIWSTGDMADQITVNAAGTYWATISNACGIASDTVHFIQNPVPVVNFGNDTTLCVGQMLLLNAINANSTYQWQDNSAKATYNVTTTGSYSVTVANTAGCEVKDTIQVGYDTQPPLLNLGPDTTYCGNFVRTLNSNYFNTVWSTGVTASHVMIKIPGTYWASASNGCGISYDTITISQDFPPMLHLSSASPTICTGDSVLIQVATNAGNILWNTGSSNSSIFATEVGEYWAEGWNVQTCLSSDTITIHQGPPPVFSLGNDTSICGSATVVLKVTLPDAQYKWQDNSTDSFYQVTESGLYKITVTTNCGTASSEVNINIHPDDCRLLIPSAFSPNGDGMNDFFRAFCNCPVEQFSMKVYNRWGQQIFSTQNINDGWDGIYQNVPQPLGAFVYTAEYFNYCENKLKELTGNVTLLK